MKDDLEKIGFYRIAMELWDEFWEDAEILVKDFRGKEIVKQLTRSAGSISANIEEGYGRGFGKEYPLFLRVSRGSARESKGWYRRSQKLLSQDVIEKRIMKIDNIIAMETKAIATLEKKQTLKNVSSSSK